MRNFAAWFTIERRQQIQAFFGTLAPLAILFGFGTEGVWEQVLIITGAVLYFLASVLSLVNVQWRDWSTKGWAIVRAAVFALAATVSPSLVLLGFYDQSTNAAILSGLSIALGSLSSLLAIFASGKQQLALAA